MEPKKHHYIPVFYLKQWARNSDKRLCEFLKPYLNRVVAKTVYPAMTAYLERLYEIRGLSAEKSQQIEQNLFQKVDSRAADAMKFLIDGVDKREWPKSLITSWTRFLLSLMFRMPEDLDILRVRWRTELSTPDRDLEEIYGKSRTADDPDSLADYISKMPEADSNIVLFDLVTRLHNLETVIPLINNMPWKGLCCTNRLMAEAPLSPDRLIP